MFKLFFLSGFLLMSITAWGQNVVLKGIVFDKNTDEPIPFSSVQFKGTTIGTSANDKGEYTLNLDFIPSDTLLARAIGYTTKYIAIDKAKQQQTINIQLSRMDYALDEFVIHAGVNPALIILKKIIQHKPENNPDRLAAYSQKVYNKLEVDLNQLNKEKILHSKLLKPFAFILKNIDSTSEDKPFLPIFLTETLSKYYYQKSPKKTREIIQASHQSGINNKSLTQFLGTMYQNVNVYDNFIPVFGKNFPSPINNNATLYYNYQLVDTQYIDNRKCYQISFEPKHKEGQYFFGDFWVNDTTFAIQKMNLQVTRQANINFVHQINLVQEFKPLGDTLWFLVKDKFIADFVPIGEKRPGLIGRKTTYYYDITVNDTAVSHILSLKKYQANNIYIADSAMKKSDSFWATHRYAKLSKNENAIYNMMDTLETMPLYHKYTSIIQFITTGTKAFGPIELGPYYYLVSANDLEKIRVRFDMGTTPDLFKDIYLHGYLAYGFGDRKYKGSMSGLWLLKRHPRMYLYAAYTHDLDNGQATPNEISTDNIFTLAIRKNGIPQKFVMKDEKRLELYKEWFSGFSLHGAFTNTKFSPYAPLPIKNDIRPYEPLNNSEVSLSARFAWREKYLEGNYYRVGLGSQYPILKLTASFGIRDVLRSNYQYQKLQLNVSDYLPIPPFGHLKYEFYGGKIWGDLPYLLLNIHPGNELYYYNASAFNMMNRYEFLSDEWAGFNIEHDFGGGIFNYIPLLKKLKLRQFWTAKGVIGRLSDDNKAINFDHGYTFQTLRGNPYLEIGTGVENILHFIRIDFVWRVLPPTGPDVPLSRKFGIFGSFKLTF